MHSSGLHWQCAVSYFGSLVAIVNIGAKALQMGIKSE
jgi:hypothetical protein